MADDIDNDDQWLYGDAPDIPTLENDKPVEDEPAPDAAAEEAPAEELPPPPEIEDPSLKENDPETETEVENPPPPGADQEENGQEEGELDKVNGDGSDKEDSDDDSDDDVNVVIGDIKTSSAYTSLNIKRGGLLTSSSVTDKSKQQQQQSGKFTVEEFDQMGMINGMPTADFNLDTLEDKPWRKPGADITDYFNYGFNEDTWKAYCERQKRLHVNESGVGLIPLNSIGLPRGPIPIMNDNSKYSGTFAGMRKAGPPPGRRMTGAIDVIGGASQPGSKLDAPKENVIQVMTADRREYSRKPPGFPDLTMPPPSSFEEFQPEFGFNPEPEPFYGGYEPTQDVQWSNNANANWGPNDIKPLTSNPGGAPASIPAVPLGPPMVPPAVPSTRDGTPPPRRDSRERDRDREISRSRSEKPRDRDRERSHRRDRSRSRSRRHKSRSRSPSHRHRKKKSRRHEESD